MTLGRKIKSLASAAAASFAAATLLVGCDHERLTSPLLDHRACQDVALLHDYVSLRTLAFDAVNHRLLLGNAATLGVVAQAVVACEQKVRVVAVNAHSGSLSARLDVFDVEGRNVLRSISVKEGINGFIVDGQRVHVATAALRSAPIEPALGALSLNESLPSAPGKQLFTELITFDIQSGIEVGRLRYPAPSQEWLDGSDLITFGASILKLDMKTGFRTKIFDFSEAADFPIVRSSFHRLGGRLFAVVGGRDGERSRFLGRAIYSLDDGSKPHWKLVADSQLADPIFSFDDGDRIYIFSRQAQLLHVFDEETATLSPMRVELDPGIEVRAAARLKSGILVLGMRPAIDTPGAYGGVGYIYLFSSDFSKLRARAEVPGVGHAPVLSSSLRQAPSGSARGYLGG